MKTSLRTTCLLFAIFTSFCAPLFVTAQDNGDIPLHGNNPPGNNPHSPAQVPISCYLISSASTVLLSSASITTPAHVEINNLTTGLTSTTDIVISSIPVPLSLLGPGDYSIEITLPSGIVYSGLFSFYSN